MWLNCKIECKTDFLNPVEINIIHQIEIWWKLRGQKKKKNGVYPHEQHDVMIEHNQYIYEYFENLILSTTYSVSRNWK